MDESIIKTDRGLELEITIRLPHGLHSRPSARLAQLAREYEADITLLAENGEADAKSMLDVLSIAPSANGKLRFLAKGADAEEALAALRDFFNNYQE